jgi:DNA-binding FadR family transcriptional regulator
MFFIYLHSSDDLTSMEKMIKRSGVCDEIVKQLQQQIISGKYKIGDKLPSESEMMQELGVGRSSVREAVRILANYGLLRVKQGLGTFVHVDSGTYLPWYQRLQDADSKDLHEVRQLLELKIAEKAAMNRTQKDIDKMTKLLKKRIDAAKKNLAAECIEADIQFHIAIAEAAKNNILTDLYKNIAAQVKKSFRQAYTDTGAFILQHELHVALLQSIIDKNPKKAWQHVAKITGQVS